MKCAWCGRGFDPDAKGRHAARFWLTTPRGQMCRTCQDRVRRGDLAPEPTSERNAA